MDLEKIGQLVTAVMSAIAIFISIVKGNKKKLTYDEIVNREELKAQKRIAKKLKKAKLNVDTNTKSEDCQVIEKNNGLSSEEVKQVNGIIYKG